MDKTEDIHTSTVDAWLTRAAAGGSSSRLLSNFQAALSGLWTRAVRTLGTVTLNAVANRVLTNAIERYEFLEAIGPLPPGRIRCDELHLEQRLAGLSFGELVLGIRSVLVELLALLSSITADILTAELHAELDRVAPREFEPRQHVVAMGAAQ